jgi:hypothetical protein
MAAETVPAIIVFRRSVSTVGARIGVEAVGSPGTAQATIVAKNIRAMKNVRLLFMVFFLCYKLLNVPQVGMDRIWRLKKTAGCL